MSFVKRNYVDGETVITAANLNDIQDALIDLESTRNVPTDVRQAIYTLLENAAYVTTGLENEIAIVQAWAQEVTALTLVPTTLELNNDTPQYITAAVVPAGSAVSWSSSDEEVATVMGGIVTGVGNGSCVITATAGSKSAKCMVTVSGFATLESISVEYTPRTIILDSDHIDLIKRDLVVTATYSDSRTEIISADRYTLDGALEVGTATITAIFGGKTDTFDVSVLKGLPSGYTRIEYIERPYGTGTSTGYNSTYFQLNGTDEAVVKLSAMTTHAPAQSGGYFLICRATNNNNTIGFGVYGAQALVNYGAFDGTVAVISPFDGETMLNKRVDIEVTKRTNGMTITDGTHTETITTTPRSMASNLYVFGMIPYTGTTLQSPAYGRIYSLLIYQGGDLKVNFIPCRQESDGKVGFYDPIANAFRNSPPYIGGSDM